MADPRIRFRRMVSLEKRRFVDKEFDLDLSYITSNIIAFGFPSEGKEKMYRNPMHECQRFFETYHRNRYFVYNLCIEKERQYRSAKFMGRVAKFQWEDHNAPPLEMIGKFCDHAVRWLIQHPENVVAVHCKAGKGRTGVMICSLLVYLSICRTFEEAVIFYGLQRTHNGLGVTIPSQLRFVGYYSQIIKNSLPVPENSPMISIKSITLNSISNFDDPHFGLLVENNGITHHRKKGGPHIVYRYQSNSMCLDIDYIHVNGNFKITIQKPGKKKEGICWFWLHTFFITSKEITLDKKDIDRAVSDRDNKIFSPSFSITLHFATIGENINTVIANNNLLQNGIDNNNNNHQIVPQSQQDNSNESINNTIYSKRITLKLENDKNGDFEIIRTQIKRQTRILFNSPSSTTLRSQNDIKSTHSTPSLNNKSLNNNNNNNNIDDNNNNDDEVDGDDDDDEEGESAVDSAFLLTDKDSELFFQNIIDNMISSLESSELTSCDISYVPVSSGSGGSKKSIGPSSLSRTFNNNNNTDFLRVVKSSDGNYSSPNLYFGGNIKPQNLNSPRSGTMIGATRVLDLASKYDQTVSVHQEKQFSLSRHRETENRFKFNRTGQDKSKESNIVIGRNNTFLSLSPPPIKKNNNNSDDDENVIVKMNNSENFIQNGDDDDDEFGDDIHPSIVNGDQNWSNSVSHHDVSPNGNEADPSLVIISKIGKSKTVPKIDVNFFYPPPSEPAPLSPLHSRQL